MCSNVQIMATIKFQLQSKSKSAPIYCRLSLTGSKYLKRKTGLSCDPQQWSKARGLPIDRDTETKDLKEKLQGLSSGIINALNRDNSEGVVIDGDWLTNTIEAHFGRKLPEELDYLTTYAQHFVNNLPYKVSDTGGLGVSLSTQKKYTSILNKIKAFETHKKKRYLIKQVDLKFRSELIKYLAEVDGLSNNTIGRYIKFVKTFVLDAQKNGYEVNPQIHDFKGFTVKASKVTLSFDELDNLRNTTFEDGNLEASKDWLIIGCYVGQRVSDLLRMNAQMITEYGGYPFIVITQQKTGKTVQIPVHPVVKEILEKRSGRFPPVWSNNGESNTTIFNRYLKRLCELAEMNTPTEGTLFDPETKRSIIGKFPKWKLVSSHICRRSFATNFYADPKYPTPLLMNITAHSSEKMFLEYIGKQPMDYSLKLAETWANEVQSEKEKPNLKVFIGGKNL